MHASSLFSRPSAVSYFVPGKLVTPYDNSGWIIRCSWTICSGVTYPYWFASAATPYLCIAREAAKALKWYWTCTATLLMRQEFGDLRQELGNMRLGVDGSDKAMLSV